SQPEGDRGQTGWYGEHRRSVHVGGGRGRAGASSGGDARSGGGGAARLLGRAAPGRGGRAGLPGRAQPDAHNRFSRRRKPR
ncbi:MAG: hypothetical protein KDA57_23830, partial [Planctomycetales bacterium]|nr:hypothetical protein [Planctomycetales bacterium]